MIQPAHRPAAVFRITASKARNAAAGRDPCSKVAAQSLAAAAASVRSDVSLAPHGLRVATPLLPVLRLRDVRDERLTFAPPVADIPVGPPTTSMGPG